MPPKRKPEAVPEPSPPPKKRSSKSAPSSDKKKRTREEVPDGASKSRRKKKVEEEDEEEESDEAPLTPVVTTASKAKRATKAPPTTPTTKGKATPPPSMPKSALKTTNSKPRARKSVVHMELPPEVDHAKHFSPIACEAASPAQSPRRRSASTAAREVPMDYVEKSADDVEITSLWNQTWGALFLCLTTIGPLFLVIVTFCYFLGALQQSQAIASVGVVYTLLFVTIMGSYTLAILPCILIARVFTSIVSPHATSHTPEEINLYSRMLVLIGVAAGLTYHFVCNHA